MSNTKQGSEETFQLPTHALSLEMSSLKLLGLKKVTPELGFKYLSEDGGTEKAADTHESLLSFQ